MFDKDLNWSTHIDNISKKASSTLGFVRRNLKNCPAVSKKTAYLALVRSTMEYGASVWDPPLEKNIYKLEKIQRKAARFIKNDFRSKTPGCVTKMLCDLDLPSLQSRRKEKRLIFLFNIQKGTVPAIPKEDYLKPIKPKRQVRAKTFTDCVSTNFV